MYFPYLRGKQYELLALKELSDLLGSSGKIVPILEPVREPVGSGLDRCISSLMKNEVDFILIMNPSVGNLKQRSSVSPEIESFLKSNSDRASRWNLGLIIEEHTNVDRLFKSYKKCSSKYRQLTLIHKERCEDADALLKASDRFNRQFDVINSNLRRRHYKEFLINSKGITLSDPFPAQERNSDYPDSVESTFSEEHIYLEDDKWFGFSDYLTIGESYNEGGFTPRAVVIHWTYQIDVEGPIMIQHFTSDSNKDTSDVAGKFLEALKKLVPFLDENDIHTRAAETLRLHLAKQTYPGLGILKKLSMQNHLELVSEILRRQ